MNGKKVKQCVFGLLLLSVLIGAVLHRSEIEEFAKLTRKARPLWLGVAAVLQIGTYLSVASAWRVVLRQTEKPLSLFTMVPLAFAKLFSDQAMPSGGMSGSAFLVTALSRRGIPKPVCMAMLLVSLLSSYAARLLAAAFSVALLWFFHQLQPWILVVTAIFSLLAITIPTAALWLQHHGSSHLPHWVQELSTMKKFLKILKDIPKDLLHKPSVLWTATAFQILVILLDSTTLWIMLFAVGVNGSFLVVFPSFVLASMVAMIGPIPLGLGTFEASCVAVLHLLGIPVATALTATLLFRGFTMWLPMLPGMWLARRELAGKKGPDAIIKLSPSNP